LNKNYEVVIYENYGRSLRRLVDPIPLRADSKDETYKQLALKTKQFYTNFKPLYGVISPPKKVFGLVWEKGKDE